MERRGEKRGGEKIPLSAPMSFLSPPLYALATRGYTCVQPKLVVHALNGRFSSYLPYVNFFFFYLAFLKSLFLGF